MRDELPTPRSPLTAGPAQLVQRLPADELAERWSGAFGIDIRSELHGVAAIELYRCEQTGLRFFWPPEVAGSAALYDQLARNDWYYLERKWEHLRALDDLKQARNLLEIGCGSGSFLKLAQEKLRIPCVGAELTESAAQAARDAGLNVESASDTIGRWLEAGRKFDAVCAFQVLEHVVAPRELLSQLVGLLAPRGRLLLSVPDYGTRFGKDDNLLDMPPHHMTQWDRASLGAIAPLFSLRLLHFAHEPLAAYHVDWYCTMLAKQLRARRATRLASPAVSRILRPLLKASSALRARVRGQGIYACFERNG